MSRYMMIRASEKTGVWLREFAIQYSLKNTHAVDIMVKHFQQLDHEQRKAAILASTQTATSSADHSAV